MSLQMAAESWAIQCLAGQEVASHSYSVGTVQPRFHYKYMQHCNIHEFTWPAGACIPAPIHVPPMQHVLWCTQIYIMFVHTTTLSTRCIGGT